MSKAEIESWVRQYVEEYPRKHPVETKWKAPIVGIACARDPLYMDLKKIISPRHVLPEEVISGAKSVIAFFVPFADDVVESNVPGEESSREWDYAYIETNQMLEGLTNHLYERITEKGYAASNFPPTYNYDYELLYSDWCHRSSAYIAGIGTFGINNMLITEAGCCGRLGSIITSWDIPADERPKGEFCLYKSQGTCGECMSRCVNSAFSVEDGKIVYDRYKCNEQIYEKIVPQWPIGPGDTCGKCMCGLPCSTENPNKANQ